MSYVSNEDLRNLCIQNGWFEGGTEEQYEKLFEANTSGASDEKLSIMIYLCSDASQEEILKVLQNYKTKFPNPGDAYWRINGYGDVVNDIWSGYEESCEELRYGNCFATEESARYTLKALKVYCKLKYFAEANNTKEIDWNNKEPKYILLYSYDSSKINCEPMFSVKDVGQIYFSSEEIARRAIEFVGEDNIKKYLFGIEE